MREVILKSEMINLGISFTPKYTLYSINPLLNLGISHDDATASVVGNANKRASRKKFLRNMELRDKLMADLEEGDTALLSFQQAIGGSLSKSEQVCEGLIA